MEYDGLEILSGMIALVKMPTGPRNKESPMVPYLKQLLSID